MATITLIHTAGVRLALAERRHPARVERRRGAWQQLVKRAVELEAAAVLVAGDLLGVTRLAASELAEIEQQLLPLREGGVALLVAPSAAECSPVAPTALEWLEQRGDLVLVLAGRPHELEGGWTVSAEPPGRRRNRAARHIVLDPGAAPLPAAAAGSAWVACGGAPGPREWDQRQHDPGPLAEGEPGAEPGWLELSDAAGELGCEQVASGAPVLELLELDVSGCSEPLDRLSAHARRSRTRRRQPRLLRLRLVGSPEFRDDTLGRFELARQAASLLGASEVELELATELRLPGSRRSVAADAELEELELAALEELVAAAGAAAEPGLAELADAGLRLLEQDSEAGVEELMRRLESLAAGEA